MRPDERDIDDEIRSHLALSIKERIERGEDPAAARRAALDELGYVPAVRDSIRRVWYSRWFDAAAALGPRSSASLEACCSDHSSIAVRIAWSTSGRVHWVSARRT